MSNTVFLIDATNLVHVEFHANAAGSVDRFANKLFAIQKQFQPAELICCFDNGRSFRSEIEPAYKAHRGPKPAELTAALEDAYGVALEMFSACRVPGFEADDLLATLAARTVAAGGKAVLMSRDKDVRQLAMEGRVTILRELSLRGGQVTPTWLTAQQIDPPPHQQIDYQCLVGDRTDGIAGCPGVGEKTAKAILAKCGSLAAALDNPWSAPVTDRIRNELFKFRQRAPNVRRLVTLRRDVPIEWSFA